MSSVGLGKYSNPKIVKPRSRSGRAASLFGVLLFLFSFLSSEQEKVFAAPLSAASTSNRPNIILILTDDLDAAAWTFMPNVVSLVANQGVSFSHYYVNDSLCCPSRSSILRSQYVHSHHIEGNTFPLGGFSKFNELGEEKCTLATWLEGTGYRRALLGKYLNNYPKGKPLQYIPPGWNEWFSPFWKGGYAGYNYEVNDNQTVEHYGKRRRDFFTDVLSKKATEFVGRSLGAGDPFFLYLAPFAPHTPATPAPRHQNLFTTTNAPRVPSFNEADVSDKPDYIRQLPPLDLSITSKIDSLYRNRLRSLQAVDDMVGALISTLQSSNALSNTYIIFTSDNGFHLGQHRLRMGKKSPYEEDVRVPLLIRGPGIPAGVVRDELALETDLGPTISEWAGGTMPDFVEGRSLVPVLGQAVAPSLVWRQGLLIEHYADSAEPFEPLSPHYHGGDPPIPTYAALRTNHYKFVHYDTGEQELYDLVNDPYELNNIAGPATFALESKLETYLQNLKQCSGANCRTLENEVSEVVTSSESANN